MFVLLLTSAEENFRVDLPNSTKNLSNSQSPVFSMFLCYSEAYKKTTYPVDLPRLFPAPKRDTDHNMEIMIVSSIYPLTKKGNRSKVGTDKGR